MKLTFVIAFMEAGDEERVLSILANHWVEKGRRIEGEQMPTKRENYLFFFLIPGVSDQTESPNFSGMISNG